jgi:xanthosine utilization system XapX-like protein
LIGEQVIPVGKEMLSGATWAAAVSKAKSATHVLGLLPGRHAETKSNAIASSPESHR